MTKVIHLPNLIFLFLIYSCSNSDTIRKEKMMSLDSKNESSILALHSKYGCESNWDSLSQFTCDLHEMFVVNKKNINFEGEIKDITKVDSIYHLMVYSSIWGHEREYFADIKLDEEKYIKLKKSIKSNKRSIKGSFVFKVSNISSIFPKINSSFHDFSGEPITYQYFDFDETLIIFNGELIDFYISEIIDK